MLALTQLTMSIKQIFEGTFWSLTFTFCLLVGTSIFYYYLTAKPIITPEKFPDDKEELNKVMVAHWWNSYRHPLVAEAKVDNIFKTHSSLDSRIL